MRRARDKAEESDNRCYVDKQLRIIHITGEITLVLASNFRRHFLSLSQVKKPITVEINSPGGDIDAGLMIINTIQLSKNKVVTRVTGQAFSMACIIACVGDRREMLPDSLLMAHAGSFTAATGYYNLKNEVDYIKLIDKRCWNIMDQYSKKAVGYWKRKCGAKDIYMTADIAIREGLIDKICAKG